MREVVQYDKGQHTIDVFTHGNQVLMVAGPEEVFITPTAARVLAARLVAVADMVDMAPTVPATCGWCSQERPESHPC